MPAVLERSEPQLWFWIMHNEQTQRMHCAPADELIEKSDGSRCHGFRVCFRVWVGRSWRLTFFIIVSSWKISGSCHSETPSVWLTLVADDSMNPTGAVSNCHGVANCGILSWGRHTKQLSTHLQHLATSLTDQFYQRCKWYILTYLTSCHAQSLTNPNCLHVLCLLAQDKFHFNMPELLANTSVLEDSARCCGETCLPGDILHVLPYYIYII